EKAAWVAIYALRRIAARLRRRLRQFKGELHAALREGAGDDAPAGGAGEGRLARHALHPEGDLAVFEADLFQRDPEGALGGDVDAARPIAAAVLLEGGYDGQRRPAQVDGPFPNAGQAV